jgi:hypothetical protein
MAWNGERSRVRQRGVGVEMEEDELLERFGHEGEVMSRRDDMSRRDLSYGLNCREPSSTLTNQDYDDAMCKCNRSDLHMLLRACPPPPSLFSPLSSTMASLSPPPMRHRASSTNLRPALTISTLGPRPKACAYLEPIPATPQATTDIRKVAPSLASPSRLSTLIERCVDLLHVYSHLPPYSSPSTPVSPSEDSVLPMSATTTLVGDDVEEKQSAPLEGPKPSPSRPWFRSMPSVCSTFFILVTRALNLLITGSYPHIICDHNVPSVNRSSRDRLFHPPFYFFMASKLGGPCPAGA